MPCGAISERSQLELAAVGRASPACSWKSRETRRPRQENPRSRSRWLESAVAGPLIAAASSLASSMSLISRHRS